MPASDGHVANSIFCLPGVSSGFKTLGNDSFAIAFPEISQLGSVKTLQFSHAHS